MLNEKGEGEICPLSSSLCDSYDCLIFCSRNICAKYFTPNININEIRRLNVFQRKKKILAIFFFQILNSLTLAVESGQTVALVGESGCGKSTVVKLLQRFYDASNGEVSLNLILIEYTVNKIKFRQERVPCVFFFLN